MASFLTRGEDALGARGEENDEQAATAWALLPPNPRGECANSRVPSETSHGAAGLDHPARGRRGPDRRRSFSGQAWSRYVSHPSTSCLLAWWVVQL